MACACKVTKYINKVEKRYGKHSWNDRQSNISGIISSTIKKMLMWMVVIPLTPIFMTFILVRNCFTKKPISVDKIFKIG